MEIEYKHPITKNRKRIKILKTPEETSDNTYKYKYFKKDGLLEEKERYMFKKDFEAMYDISSRD